MDNSPSKFTGVKSSRAYRSHKSPACAACRKRKTRCVFDAAGEACLFCRLKGSECSLVASSSVGSSASPSAVKESRTTSGVREGVRRDEKTVLAGFSFSASSTREAAAAVASPSPRKRARIQKDTGHGFQGFPVRRKDVDADDGVTATSGSESLTADEYDEYGSPDEKSTLRYARSTACKSTDRISPSVHVRSSVGVDRLETLERVVRTGNVPVLIDLYFNSVNPYFPLLLEAEVRQSIDQQTCTPALLCQILTHACSMWSTSSQLKSIPAPDIQYLWKLSAEALDDDFKTPSMSTLLAGILDLNGRREVSNHIINELNRGRLVALAHSLGLNRDPQEWAMSPGERRFRRRTWWTIVIHDTWSSLIHSTPPLLRRENWKIPEPPVSESDHVNQHFEKYRAQVCFRSFIKLTSLLADILPRIHSLNPSTTDADPSILQWLDGRLVSWYDSLPTWLTSNWWALGGNAAPGARSLHLAYLAVKLALARMRLRTTRTASRLGQGQGQREDSKAMLGNCVAAADEIAQQVLSLKPEDTLYYWLPYSADHLAMCIAVLLRCAVEAGEDALSKTCIDNCCSILEKLDSLKRDTGWEVGDMCLERYDGMIGKVKDHVDKDTSNQGDGDVSQIGDLSALLEVGDDGFLDFSNFMNRPSGF